MSLTKRRGKLLAGCALNFLLFTISVAQSPRPTIDPSPTCWINYSQQYYKILVAENGLYRIGSTELAQAGVPINRVDPTTIQLFRRGVEQAIYLEGEADKRFDTHDFLEFYGQQNDGAQDSLLYPFGKQPHTYYSLYSDTSAYFLTWRLDGQPGKRMATYADTAFAGLTPEPYHWANELQLFTDTYPAGTIYPLGANYETGVILTNYDVGEGWTGPVIKAGAHDERLLKLTNFRPMYDNDGNAVHSTLRCLLVGRSPGSHHVRCLVGPSVNQLRELSSTSFIDYETSQIEVTLQPGDIDSSGTILVRFQPLEADEEVSLSYLNLQYPQPTDFNGDKQKVLRLRPTANGLSFLDLNNTPATIRLFDVSNPDAGKCIGGKWADGHWRGMVHDTQSGCTILATSQTSTVLAIKPVAFRQIDPQKHNYLIITHPLLRQPTTTETDPVLAYAAYRASKAGGGHDTLTVNIDQLFDQFSYGERHPLAIRRFADFMLRNGGQKPKFLFLIGQSRDPQRVRKVLNASLLDLIPNAGWPGSDIGLVEGLNGEASNVPAIPIGRLNTASSQRVLDYLNKVKEHENSTEPGLWRKNILHLSGGRSRYELLEFRSFVDEFKSVIEAPYAGGRVTTIAKRTDNLVESLPIAELVNQGVGMITLFGHSSLDVADIDIGFVSNDILNYRNKGRYPFVLVNGCAAGNTYFGRPTFGTDWILTPNRGAVLFLAHTYNGFAAPLKSYSDQLYKLLSDSQYVAQPMGLIQQEAIRRHLNANNSMFDLTTAQQMTLQGDPAVRVFPFSNPDFSFAPGSLRVQSLSGDSLTAQSDSARISGILVNDGRVTKRSLTLRIRQYEPNGELLHEQFFTQPAPIYADTLQWTIPYVASTSPAYFELFLDPNDQIGESNEGNNKAEISTTSAANGLPFEPDATPPLLEVSFDGQRIRDGDLVSAQPVIALLIQDENRRLLRTDTTGLELYLQRPCPVGACAYERLWLKSGETQWIPADSTNAFRLHYRPTRPLADGLYGFVAVGRDLSGNRTAPYQIHFSVKNQPELVEAGVYPNPVSHQTRFFVTITGVTPPANLSIRILDLAGHLVRTLRLPTRIGLNEWHWDGTSDDGSLLPTGTYIYRIDGANLPNPNDTRLTGRVILNR